MADEKISQLQSYTSPQSEDLLLIIANPNQSPFGKNITLKALFGNLPSNTSIDGTLEVTGNATFSGTNNTFQSLNITDTLQVYRVNASNALIVPFMTPDNVGTGMAVGQICIDANYFYAKTANNVVKRGTLSTF
jgi:hypothetical protein